MKLSTASSVAVSIVLLTIHHHFRLIECNVVCPEDLVKVCDCHRNTTTSLSLRCWNRELTTYPPFGDTKQLIRHLDMSFNRLTTLPNALVEFTLLETLDLSHNHIETIVNDIRFPVNLRTLSLAHNKISNWMNLNPNTLLRSAINLHTLDLAGNPLKSFSTNDERLLLVSGSLKLLDLSDCQIGKVGGPLVLSGMVKLEHLSLSNNPITTIPDLIATDLISLDLSRCQIGSLRSSVFINMPQLTSINLSYNPRLSLISDDDGDGAYVASQSIRFIDLSQCNLNDVELDGMPNITTAILRNNMIRQVQRTTFEKNTEIENIDLSYNSITFVSTVAFSHLHRLKIVDLSFNMIREIEPYTFVDNQQLMTINLSRNYIAKLKRFVSQSIAYLNMSWCEITSIDRNALEGLPDLVELDLSNNLFAQLGHLESKLLHTLDLSQCRISSIDNETFAGFPELTRLNLAGNRLTTIFSADYFRLNQFLTSIWMGDNPWICDCSDYDMQSLYGYLTDYPPRAIDQSQLRCNSPREHFDKFWETACFDTWYKTPHRTRLLERLWTIAMVILINVSIVCCAAACFKKWMRHRKEAEEEDERLRNLETAREVMEHNQRVLEQEGQLNAPDPRETNPPRYEDAILLPRLDTSFASLRRAGMIGDPYGIEDDIKRAVKRSRCRSEEILNTRDASTVNPFASRMRRHIRAARIRRTRPPCDSALEIPRLTARTVANTSFYLASSNSFSFEPIRNFDSTEGGSPYAKRKNIFELNDMAVPSTSTALADSIPTKSTEEIVIIENHYVSKTSLTSSEPQKSDALTNESNPSISISYSTMPSTSTTSSASSIDDKDLFA